MKTTKEQKIKILHDLQKYYKYSCLCMLCGQPYGFDLHERHNAKKCPACCPNKENKFNGRWGK